MASPQQVLSATAKSQRLSPFRSLEDQRYRILWLASFLSISMWMMQLVARGWLVLEITDSAFYVGLAAAVGSAPMLVFSLIGGVIADRFNRKAVLIANEVAGLTMYGLMALLVALDVIQVWHILAISFVSGVSFALSMPSRQAIIPNLVKREDLGNAIALSTIMFSGAQTVGPALAGGLVAWVGLAWCFAVTSITLVIPTFLLARLQVAETSTPSSSENVFANLVEGLRYTRGHPLILSLIAMGSVGTIFAMPYQALMPVMARDVLNSGSQGMGLLLGSAGVGALLGSLGLAAMGSDERIGKALVLGALGGGISVTLFAMSPVFLLSLVLMFIVGFVMQLQMTSNFTLVQMAVPDELRGRVLSIRMVIFGMMPIGQLLGGWVSDVLGAPMAIALGGAVATVLMAGIILAAKEVRESWSGIRTG